MNRRSQAVALCLLRSICELWDTHSLTNTHTPVTITIKVLTLALNFTLRVDISHPDRNFPSEWVCVRVSQELLMAELCRAHKDRSLDLIVDSLIHFLCPVLWKGELYRTGHTNTKAALVSFPFQPVRLASQCELCYARWLLPKDAKIRFPSFSSLPHHSFSISPLLIEERGSLLLNMRWMFCAADIHSSHPF